MLILDPKRDHITDRVKKVVANSGCELTIIQCRWTHILQPQDMVLNKPFEDHKCAFYSECLGTRKPADAKREAEAHFYEVAQRVNDAWYRLPTDMDRDAFIMSSISVALPSLATASSSSGSQDGNDSDYSLLLSDGS
ncbi:hypothetical protein HPB51_007294 [Rhipicephalus microplus]|uniref:Uncharacterized protein n=1 Tax=Rhipicephalus microplus TaxID=6941 RepID=A0A9J6EFD7_RHIMP|nr:hypothetical protein HPB51_007294 [Rhipicephalus microplus]